MGGGRRLAIVGLLMGLGVPTAPMGAQSTGSSSDLTTVLSRTDVGQRLRAGTSPTLVEGSLVDFGPGFLELRTASGLHRVDFGPGDSLWTAVDAKRMGALVGALAGVGLTAGFCIETFDECGLDVGLLIVTPALALIGAAVGAQLTSWRLLLSPSD